MSQIMASIDASGRLVVPKEMRVSLGVEGGGELMLSLEDGALVAMTRAEALRRLRDRLRQAVPPEHSLAAELIADRRQDAARRG